MQMLQCAASLAVFKAYSHYFYIL